jgi:hypothetical protein
MRSIADIVTCRESGVLIAGARQKSAGLMDEVAIILVAQVVLNLHSRARSACRNIRSAFEKYGGIRLKSYLA